ncbi:MAG TPA: hypothetical protein VGO43_05400 [Pyrinomonadaceae bacterium]|jgi:hypothetical protein|nr:hypothetical protein [Pyrinomonadaceae bacterium]
MLNRFLILIWTLIIGVMLFIIPFPEGLFALAFVVILSGITVLLMRRFTENVGFLTQIFFVGLALRMACGIFVHMFELRDFFGGDAVTYDRNGSALVDFWLSNVPMSEYLEYQNSPASGAGWGMNYLVGAIYVLFGRNILAAQSFCGVIGAATAPMVYFCAHKIFSNVRVAKIAAVSVALSPAFVIWSGQLLKDGLIIFLLVLTMTMVLQLQLRMNYAALLALAFAMFGIFSLRFYIFYALVVAVVGSFVAGVTKSQTSLIRRMAVMVILAVGLTYFMGRNASQSVGTFANLDRLQTSRKDLARSATSGYGEDADVSTTGGALATLPIGFTYLMFAPFPWQLSSLRQAIAIPEVLVWWAMMPLLVMGLIYTVKNKFRNAFPVLIFCLLLTLAYSIFQGNVGTAYRQRTQIQVFMFMLVAVGWTVRQESRENKRILRSAKSRALESRLRSRASQVGS